MWMVAFVHGTSSLFIQTDFISSNDIDRLLAFWLIGLLLEPVYYILPYLLFILLAYLFLTPRQPLEQSPSLSTPK